MNYQMVVIGHQRERQKNHSGRIKESLQDVKETLVVCGGKEDLLTVYTTIERVEESVFSAQINCSYIHTEFSIAVRVFIYESKRTVLLLPAGGPIFDCGW